MSRLLKAIVVQLGAEVGITAADDEDSVRALQRLVYELTKVVVFTIPAHQRASESAKKNQKPNYKRKREADDTAVGGEIIHSRAENAPTG